MTGKERSVFCNVEHPKTHLRPHSKTRQELRERLMRGKVDRMIEECREVSAGHQPTKAIDSDPPNVGSTVQKPKENDQTHEQGKGKGMTCKDCQYLVWFGDYSLHYCGLTRDQVEEDDECHHPEQRNKKVQ